MILFNKMFSSGLLRPQSSKGPLKNFQDFLSLKNKLEDLQQEVYQSVLAKSVKPSTIDSYITLVRKGLLKIFNTEKADPDLLLPCVLASGVPVKDIMTIKAKLWKKVTRSDWESFDILTREGAVIQEINEETWGQGHYGTAYSSVIHEMIKQGKLLKAR